MFWKMHLQIEEGRRVGSSYRKLVYDYETVHFNRNRYRLFKSKRYPLLFL